jgi:hypothetical protein
VLAEGYTVTPNLVLRYAAQLQITTGELLLIQYVFLHWRDLRTPCPSVTTLARFMGKSPRMIRYYLRSLQTKGLLVLEERVDVDGGRQSNGFDFGPLLRVVAALHGAECVQSASCQVFQGRSATDCRGGLQSVAAIEEVVQDFQIEENPLDPPAAPCSAKAAPHGGTAAAPPQELLADSLPERGRADLYHQLQEVTAAIGREFGDQAHPRVTARRAYNLFVEIRCTFDTFLALVSEAAERTRAARGVGRRQGPVWHHNRVPYFFATLESLLREIPTVTPPAEPPGGLHEDPVDMAGTALPVPRRPQDADGTPWERVKAALARMLTPAVYTGRLARTWQLDFDGSRLVVAVPTKQDCQWLQARLGRQLHAALNDTGLIETQVCFVPAGEDLVLDKRGAP